jgi:membrane protein YqaA with SNARE-associated domain
LHFLKTIFLRYQHWLLALLAPLPGWAAVLVVATTDSIIPIIPLDPVLAGYVWMKPHLFWLYCLLASVGSAVGSLVPYWIGYEGEELLLEKRVPAATLARIRASFEKHEVLALVLPAMMPPPTPFKAFILFAGAAKLNVRDFMLSIFAGRMLRFLILSVLTVVFGPRVYELVKKHGWMVLGVVVAAILLGVLLWLLKKRRAPGGTVGGEGS